MDYLGIDLPEFIYNPLYGQFQREHPKFTISKLDEYYQDIMQYSIDNDIPELAQYILSNTDAKLHESDDEDLLASYRQRRGYVEGEAMWKEQIIFYR